jgi:hypothetical protein
MPVRPYTTPELIEQYLGRLFATPQQTAWATATAAGITVWIDHRTGRTWQGTESGATILDEPQTVHGISIYLDHAPVASVQVLEYLDGLVWVVVDPANYALTDPSHGVVTVPGSYNGAAVRVDYTAAGAALVPPSDIVLAATVLAADYLTTALAPESFGVESVAVGQNDISVHYAGSSGAASARSAAAIAVVDSYRKVVLA